jgi:hypothetical protein
MTPNNDNGNTRDNEQQSLLEPASPTNKPQILYGVSIFQMDDGTVHLELSGEPKPTGNEAMRLVADCHSILESQRIAATVAELLQKIAIAGQSKIVRPRQ